MNNSSCRSSVPDQALLISSAGLLANLILIILLLLTAFSASRVKSRRGGANITEGTARVLIERRRLGNVQTTGSSSVLQRAESVMSALKEEEQEEASLCLDILHDPKKYLVNLPLPEESGDTIVNIMRRVSVISSLSECKTD